MASSRGGRGLGLRRRAGRELVALGLVGLLPGCDRGAPAAPERVLRTASTTDVPTLDPAVGYDTTSWQFEQMIFGTLLDYDDGGKLVSEMAERWEVDDEGLVHTFVLDPRARFSSGRRVTASDVKYSLERVLRPATRSQGAEFFQGIVGAAEFAAGEADEVAGIEADGDRIVRIRLRRHDPIFGHKMAMQFAAVVPREVAEMLGDDFSSRPEGSGPFVLDRWERGRRLLLRRNPHYFRPDEPRLEAIEHLVGVNEQLEWLKYESGELDVADIPASEFPLVEGAPEFADRLVSKTSMRTTYLGINCRVPPFDDVRVRRAVSHSIDRAKLLRLVSGRGQAATSLVPPGIAGFDADAPVAGYDPAAARAELRAAGLGDGFDTVLWVRTDESILRLAQSMQQDLAVVGIRARIKNLAWASFLEAIRTPERTPLFLLGWEADFPDASNFLEVLLHSRNVDSNNYSFFADAEFDRLVDLAADEREEEARLRLLRQAQDRMLALTPLVPLYYPVEYKAIQRRVRGFTLHPLRPPRFDSVWLE